MLAGTCVDPHSTHCLAQAAPSQHVLSVAVHRFPHKAACTVCGHTSIAATAHVVLAFKAGAQMSTGWHYFRADSW